MLFHFVLSDAVGSHIHVMNETEMWFWYTFCIRPASATYSGWMGVQGCWLESECRMLCIKTRQNHKTENIILIICVIIVAVKPERCFIFEQDLN